MKIEIKNIFVTVVFVCAGTAQAQWGTATISAQAGPWPITIQTCAHDAGAICSLNWRDKEFINDYDHGRQLQSAVHFNDWGEDFNPTEAGGAWTTKCTFNANANDCNNPSPSSSVLQAMWTAGNVLATQTDMAFWRQPAGRAQQSGYILNKQVTIGYMGMPHVIEYLTQYTIPAGEPRSLTSGIFEVVTGYMHEDFSQMMTFDVKNGATNTVVLDKGPGEQSLPIIFSTNTGSHAMGIYSPDSPQQGLPSLGYGRWDHAHDKYIDANGNYVSVPVAANTYKWNNVFRVSNPSGTYHFRSYVIVGSLENVKVSMQQLFSIVH